MRSYNQKGFALTNVKECNGCGHHPTPLSNGKTGLNKRYTICCLSCNNMVGWHNTIDEAVDAWEEEQRMSESNIHDDKHLVDEYTKEG